MPWDLFLMKVLIKEEVCRSRKQCIGPIGSAETRLSQKKKKKTQTLKMRERRYPNGYLDLFTAEQCDIWPLIHSLNS